MLDHVLKNINELRKPFHGMIHTNLPFVNKVYFSTISHIVRIALDVFSADVWSNGMLNYFGKRTVLHICGKCNHWHDLYGPHLYVRIDDQDC